MITQNRQKSNAKKKLTKIKKVHPLQHPTFGTNSSLQMNVSLILLCSRLPVVMSLSQSLNSIFSFALTFLHFAVYNDLPWTVVVVDVDQTVTSLCAITLVKCLSNNKRLVKRQYHPCRCTLLYSCTLSVIYGCNLSIICHKVCCMNKGHQQKVYCKVWGVN